MCVHYGPVEVQSYPLLTSALDGGDWPFSHPGERALVTIQYEAWWAAETVWTFWKRESIFPLSEIEPRFLGCPGSSLVTIPIFLFRLPLYFTYGKETIHYLNNFSPLPQVDERMHFKHQTHESINIQCTSNCTQVLVT